MGGSLVLIDFINIVMFCHEVIFCHYYYCNKFLRLSFSNKCLSFLGQVHLMFSSASLSQIFNRSLSSKVY